MQTSLDFLNPGSSWPPEADRERLKTYTANKKLFESKHHEVFRDWVRLLREDQNATLELILNWHKRLSTLWADLLVGEPPRFKAGDEGSDEQEAVDRIVESNELHIKTYEIALDISRYGDGLFKIYLQDGQAVIEGQSPQYWFPVVSADNLRKIEAHVLAWTFGTRKEKQLFKEVEKSYLRVEIHRKGEIENRLYLLEDGEITEQLSDDEFIALFPDRQPIEPTEVDDFLIVPVAGLRTTDRLFGIDDYSDLETIIQEMEVRIAQISRILDKHADPNMYGPEDALTQNPETGQWEFKGGGEYFPVGKDESPPGYVTWEGQLEAAFREIETLMEQLYFLSETSPAAFGQLKSGLAESGSALKRLLLAPLAKVNRIRLRFDPAIKKVLKLAAELERAHGSGTPLLENVTIEWRDGLPEDPKEAAEIEEIRLRSGTSSRYSSIRRLDGGTDEEVTAEIDRIVEDMATEAGAGVPGGRSLFGGDE